MSKSKDSKQDIIKIGIVWFRNDLRTHDNLVLKEAYDLIVKKKIDEILPIFCYDQELFTGKFNRFLLEVSSLNIRMIDI